MVHMIPIEVIMGLKLEHQLLFIMMFSSMCFIFPVYTLERPYNTVGWSFLNFLWSLVFYGTICFVGLALVSMINATFDFGCSPVSTAMIGFLGTALFTSWIALK